MPNSDPSPRESSETPTMPALGVSQTGDSPTLPPSATAPGQAPSVAGMPRVTGRRASDARGGLGEVHVAEDLELHREVALKCIQRDYADNAASRRRFLVEAEVTARLRAPWCRTRLWTRT